MITNRHMHLLACLVTDPAVARRDPATFQALVRAGLAARTLDGEREVAGHVTDAGVAALDRWLGRPAGLANGMTHRMADALDVIRASTAARGIPPSYAELRAALGLSSKSGVHRLVVELEQRGMVTRLPGRKRSVTPTGYEARP